MVCGEKRDQVLMCLSDNNLPQLSPTTDVPPETEKFLMKTFPKLTFALEYLVLKWQLTYMIIIRSHSPPHTLVDAQHVPFLHNKKLTLKTHQRARPRAHSPAAAVRCSLSPSKTEETTAKVLNACRRSFLITACDVAKCVSACVCVSVCVFEAATSPLSLSGDNDLLHHGNLLPLSTPIIIIIFIIIPIIVIVTIVIPDPGKSSACLDCGTPMSYYKHWSNFTLCVYVCVYSTSKKRGWWGWEPQKFMPVLSDVMVLCRLLVGFGVRIDSDPLQCRQLWSSSVAAILTLIICLQVIRGEVLCTERAPQRPLVFT